MNKTILIASGVSVASLAVGGAAGYLVAAKKLGKEFEERLETELAATKEHYTKLAEKTEAEDPDLPRMKYESGKDYAKRLAEYRGSGFGENDEFEDDPYADEPSDDEILAAEEKTDKAAAALTNYQGYSEKPELSDVARGALTAKPKKQLPPKGPDGRFLPRQDAAPVVDDPHLITETEFLADDEFDTVYLLYFVHDKTLLHVHDNNEPVDTALVGETNLTLFPQTPDDEPSTIFVRNTQLQTNYEIQLMRESVTEYIGLGEYSEN